MLTQISSNLLKMLGWKVEMAIPLEEKCILIGAPHTSNWDFPLALLCMSALGIRFNWGAKHTIFKWPFGLFFKSIGGIPVDRRAGSGFAKKVVRLLKTSDRFILAIAPEGTRSLTQHWKTGFHTIARLGKVPVFLCFVDYREKRIGVGGKIMPTGDIEKDFSILKEFYKGKTGKYPQQQGEVRVRQVNMTSDGK